MLVEHIRSTALQGTAFACTLVTLIRLELFKIGARVLTWVRRIVIHLATGTRSFHPRRRATDGGELHVVAHYDNLKVHTSPDGGKGAERPHAAITQLLRSYHAPTHANPTST